MNPNVAIAEACARAAGVIAERGWCQDAYEDGDGKVCLMGAICRATETPVFKCNFEDLTVACSDALLAAINGASANDWNDPTVWNDHPQRDAREVIDLLEGVAWQYQIKAEADKELALVG